MLMAVLTTMMNTYRYRSVRRRKRRLLLPGYGFVNGENEFSDLTTTVSPVHLPALWRVVIQ